MRLLDAQIIGSELALKWEGGSESFIALEKLRRECPCAGCRGEGDVMGKISKPAAQRLTPKSFQIARLVPVGGYGLQPFWADGHNTGIYSFPILEKLGAAP